MAIPDFLDFGAEKSAGVGSSDAARTPTQPGSLQAGRCIVLYVASDGVPATLQTANGWVLAQDPNGNTASVGVAGQCAMAIYWKRAGGTSETMPVLNDPSVDGNTCIAFHANVYSNVRTSDTPFHKISTATVTSPTTTISPPSITSTINDCMFGAVAASSNEDTLFQNWGGSGFANPAASIDSGWATNLGNDCAWTGGRGGKATAGAGQLTSAFAASTQQAQISYALASLAETSHSRAAAIGGAGAVTAAGAREALRSAAIGATGAIEASGSVEAGGSEAAVAIDAVGVVAVAGQRDLKRAVALDGAGGIAAGRMVEHKRAAAIGGIAAVEAAYGTMQLGDYGADRALFGTGAGTVSVTLDVPVSGAVILVCTGGNLSDLVDPPTDSEGNTYTAAGVEEFAQWAGYGIRMWVCTNPTGDAALVISQEFGQTLGFDECTIVAVAIENAAVVEDDALIERVSGATVQTPAVVATGPAEWVVFYSGDAPTGQTTTFSASNGLTILDETTLVDHPNGYVPIALCHATKGAGTHQSTLTHSPTQGAILGAIVVQTAHFASAAAALAATGGIAVAGLLEHTRSSAFGAAGGVTAAGQLEAKRAASFGAVAGIAAAGAGVAPIARAVEFGAAGGVVAAGVRELKRSAALDGTGAIAAAAVRDLRRAAEIGSSASIEAAGVVGAVTHERAATLDAAGAIATGRTVEHRRAASIGAAGAVDATIGPADPYIALENAIFGWVSAGSGLPDGNVIWGRNSAKNGPMPSGTFISMRLLDMASPCNGWMATEEVDGEIVHRISEPGYWTLEVTCFHADPFGANRAQLILKRLLASVRLPSVREQLRAGNVGVGRRGPIRLVDGTRSGMLDPRAIVEIGLHVMIEVSEVGAAIERALVTTETPETGEVETWVPEPPP